VEEVSSDSQLNTDILQDLDSILDPFQDIFQNQEQSLDSEFTDSLINTKLGDIKLEMELLSSDANNKEAKKH
jgi:hypothetical protein